MSKTTMNRRTILAALAATTGYFSVRAPSASEGLPHMVVHRDPSCGCCGAWVVHVRAAGFPVSVVETSELNRVKARLGVPAPLASCHTAEVADYVIEGHVPAAAIKRLLTERSHAKGLAVPGMPIGSPGMEVEGTTPELYEVVLFGPTGERTFDRYKGAHAV